jgi:hypothetical protein
VVQNTNPQGEDKPWMRNASCHPALFLLYWRSARQRKHSYPFTHCFPITSGSSDSEYCDTYTSNTRTNSDSYATADIYTHSKTNGDSNIETCCLCHTEAHTRANACGYSYTVSRHQL